MHPWEPEITVNSKSSSDHSVRVKWLFFGFFKLAAWWHRCKQVDRSIPANQKSFSIVEKYLILRYLFNLSDFASNQRHHRPPNWEGISTIAKSANIHSDTVCLISLIKIDIRQADSYCLLQSWIKNAAVYSGTFVQVVRSSAGWMAKAEGLIASISWYRWKQNFNKLGKPYV